MIFDLSSNREVSSTRRVLLPEVWRVRIWNGRHQINDGLRNINLTFLYPILLGYYGNQDLTKLCLLAHLTSSPKKMIWSLIKQIEFHRLSKSHSQSTSISRSRESRSGRLGLIHSDLEIGGFVINVWRESVSFDCSGGRWYIKNILYL